MIKSLLQEGFTLKEKGRYKHAIEVFYKALELDNTSSELLLEIAELYFLLGNEEKSLSYIEQVLDKNPLHVKSLELLKKIFLHKNAYKEAIKTAKNIYCITNQENDLIKILQILNANNIYEEIFDDYIDSENEKVLYEIAYAKYLEKKYSEAESIIVRAIEKNPSPKNHLLYGKICYAQDKKDQCVDITEKIEYDDTNAELLNFKGLLESHQEHYLTAIEYFKTAIKIDKTNDEYYYNLANVYFKIGDSTLAKKNYNLAISISPNNQKYHFALANLLYTERHYRRALEELDENMFEAKLLKSIILYDTGYLALAKKEFILLQKQNPNHHIIQTYLEKIEQDLSIN